MREIVGAKVVMTMTRNNSAIRIPNMLLRRIGCTYIILRNVVTQNMRGILHEVVCVGSKVIIQCFSID